jgi:hypothetical protein
MTWWRYNIAEKCPENDFNTATFFIVVSVTGGESEQSCVCVIRGYRFSLCFYDISIKCQNCSDSGIFYFFYFITWHEITIIRSPRQSLQIHAGNLCIILWFFLILRLMNGNVNQTNFLHLRMKNMNFYLDQLICFLVLQYQDLYHVI